MDRGRQPRPGSSLPRTLHSSLLHPSASQPSSSSQPQSPQPSATYTPSPPPPTQLLQPEDEVVDTRQLIGPGTPAPQLFLPPFRGGAPSRAPSLPPRSDPPTFYTYPPPVPGRLPSVRSLASAGPSAAGTQAVAGPSGQHYQYSSSSAAGPSSAAGSSAGPSSSYAASSSAGAGPSGQQQHYQYRSGAGWGDEFAGRGEQRGWELPVAQEEAAYGSAYDGTGRWGASGNLGREDETHVSAARSTINVSYEEQHTPERQAAAQDFSASFAALQPFYESSDYAPADEPPAAPYAEENEPGPSGLLVREPYAYPVTPTRGVVQPGSRPSSPRAASRATSAASGGGASGKRPGGSGSDEEDDSPRPRKVPKKTQVACFFCRGRKLKCDGQQPLCGNCEKRNHPCSYAPYPKRRGPGKAPKRKRIPAPDDPSRASGSGTHHQGPAAAAPRADQPLRPRASVETLPAYSRYAEPPVYAAPGPPPLPLHEPAATYPQHYQHGSGAGPSPPQQLQYPDQHPHQPMEDAEEPQEPPGEGREWG